MKLYQVRKGQFVYYKNELHKVYSVKPTFKLSIHLIRLKDLEQRLARAGEVDRYKPQPRDSFIFNHTRYTLNNHERPKEGDYILITKPNPDFMDHYSLNEIEKVATVEDNGVITYKSNGIKHNEYMLMVPGREDGSKSIDNEKHTDIEDTDTDEADRSPDGAVIEGPYIGDVFSNGSMQTMVTAIHNDTVTLGGDLQVAKKELADPGRWTFLYHLTDE